MEAKRSKRFLLPTLQAELGLFSSKRAEVSPLAVDEEMRKHLRPYLADIQAHDIWIRFIYERIEIAKYCSQEQIYMFTQVGQLFLPNFPLRTIYSPALNFPFNEFMIFVVTILIIRGDKVTNHGPEIF